VKISRDALAINISPDAKTFGRFPTLGADVNCVILASDPRNADAFGNSPDQYETWSLRPPIQQIPSKAVVANSLRRRKDGGKYQPQTSLKLAVMLTASGVSIAIANNRGAVRLASDAAQDNKGGGKQKEIMEHMSGTNSLMERLMFHGDVWSQAAKYLESLGLLGPIQQLIGGNDLAGLLSFLIKRRLERERIERKEEAARGAAKKELKAIVDKAASTAKEATAQKAELAREVELIRAMNDIQRLEEVQGLHEAAKAREKEAKKAALLAKRQYKEAAKTRGLAGGAVPDSEVALPPASASTGPTTTGPRPVPAMPAACDSESCPRLQRGPLMMSGPVPKCREEQERLFKLKMYEARMRPILKRQRFYRWIWHMWRYKAQETLIEKEANDDSFESGRHERKQSLLEHGPTQARVGWVASNRCSVFARRKLMHDIDAYNKALYGVCDGEGNPLDWKEIADEILPVIKEVLNLVKQIPDHELNHDQVDEAAEDEATSDGGCLSPADWSRILEEEHDLSKFGKGARCCGKRLSKKRADEKISRASQMIFSTVHDENEYMQKSHLFWSRFWRMRPIDAAHGVSMESNTCRFWACVDHCPVGAVQRWECGTTCHCKEHRVHNVSKDMTQTLDAECTTSLGIVAHAFHNIELGIGLRDAIEALINPAIANNEHSDFHEKLRAAVNKQYAEGTGPSMDEVIKRSGIKIGQGGDLKLEIDKPNEARWLAYFKLAHDCSRAEDLLAVALLRAKAIGVDEEAEVRAAAAVLSHRGFVSEEHSNLVMDKVRSHLFAILVSPQAKESRYMMSAMYQLILHPILALTGDIKHSAKMMGIGGLPRRLLRIITDIIWTCTAPRKFKNALAHRTDNAEVQFAKGSMKLLNPNCGPDIRLVIGEDLIPDGILEEMVDAIPTLLSRMRRLAMTGRRVVPDTTRQIFAFMFDHLYNDDGSLTWKRDGSKVVETFEIKMSQMQLHFRIMIEGAVVGIRNAFAREISSPHAFMAGAILEQWSKGTIDGKHILHPHPNALANIVVMRALGRDVMANFREQLRTTGLARGGRTDLASKNPLDFLPQIAFAWSEKGTKSSIEFTGMANPAPFEFNGPAPLEPAMLQGLSVSALSATSSDHFQSVEQLGIPAVLSQDMELKLFPMPIQKYEYIHRLVAANAAAISTSKGVETNWGRLGRYYDTRTNVSFATLCSQYTLPNAMSINLDFQSIEEDDLRFKVALEIGKLPGWRKFYDADTALRDAMHADYKHAEAAKKGETFWTSTNHGGSYRGEKYQNPTLSDKKRVLNKTLRICKLIGFGIEESKVAHFRQQLGLPEAQAKRRVPRQRQRRAEDSEGDMDRERMAVSQDQQSPQSPSQPLSLPSPPSQSPSPSRTVQAPPSLDWQLPPQSIPQPHPSQQPPSESSPATKDQSDGIGISTDDSGGMAVSGNSTEGGDGDGGDSGEAVGDEQDDGGVDDNDGRESQDSDESDGSEESELSEVDFADVELNRNTHSIAFLYDTFAACCPNWPKNCDNIWKPSLVRFNERLGVKSASVTRRGTQHLSRCLASYDLDLGLDARMKFTVYKHCNFLRYILRQSYSGMVVVNVEEFHEPQGSDWSKTAVVRRLLPTEHALQECRARKNQGIHLARPDLQKFKDSLERYQNEKCPWTKGCEVYHASDLVEEVDIRELIGVVRWHPFRSTSPPEENYFKAPYDYTTADLIYIGDPFIQTVKRGK
jgi:hypothetical protein